MKLHIENPNAQISGAALSVSDCICIVMGQMYIVGV